MKKSELRQLIKEEIRNSLKETSPVDRHKAFNKIVDMMVNKGFAQDEAEVLLNSLLKAFKGDELKGLEEIKTSPHQFGSDEERDYQTAAAKLSNAVLYLDSDDPTTMNKAQVAYEELGPKLEAHLRERFGGDTPKSFR